MTRASGRWPTWATLWVLFCALAGLGGCAMCGACYDDCYPGYLGSCQGTACRGPRAGSIRALEGVAQEDILPTVPSGSVSAPSGTSFPEGVSSPPQDIQGTRMATRPMPGLTMPSQPSSGNLPQGKPFSTHPSRSGGQATWPPSARYPGQNAPTPGSPLNLLSHWWPQPPQAPAGRQGRNSPGRVSPWGMPSGYPAQQRSPSSQPRGSSVGMSAQEVASGNMPSVDANPQAVPTQNMPMPSQNMGMRRQPVQGGVRVAQAPRSGQAPAPGYSSGGVARRSASPQEASVPPDVWAAIPPEDRATAQILSITDRKAEPTPNQAENASGRSSEGSAPANPSQLEWLPAAPLPPGG